MIGTTLTLWFMRSERMDMADWLAMLDLDVLGRSIHDLIAELYPICRSLTGDGVRQTLRLVGRHVPIEIHEVPSGTPVFDWSVPKEWNIRDAYIKNGRGERIVDFRRSNLHVLSYSVPVHKRLRLKELREHLSTIPEHPDWVPYKTAYWNEDWGFCLSHRQFLDLSDDEIYEVLIDSSLADGHLTFGECTLAGKVPDEVLVSTHVCHPSLCNDNLSGIAVAAFLAATIKGLDRRLSYRFLFVPGTVGAITWLALNPGAISRIRHGVTLACLGDESPLAYKKSRRGIADVDRAFGHVLKQCGTNTEVLEFSPFGYDERQYCSPGLNLPVGCLMRAAHGYREKHTSADNLQFVRPASLAESFSKALAAFEILEKDRTYANRSPYGEPQLGRRGLYRATGGRAEPDISEDAIRWVLNLSDGTNSLLDITERSGLSFSAVRRAADDLERVELLSDIAGTGMHSS